VGSPRPHITVVGLGPAGAAYLSTAVVALMSNAERTFLRTARHPAAEGLDGVESFDHLYDSADTFEQVYAQIVEALVAEASRHAPDPVVYAVPGSPLVAERTVELLRHDDRVDVTIVPGLSFLDLAWDRLTIDPLDEGVHLVDAEQFAAQAGGERGPFLVAQCWSQPLLSDIKLSAGPEDDQALPQVTILHHLGLDDETVRVVDWWELDRTLTPDHLTSLYIPALSSPTAVEREMARLEELVLTLRARCPWDRAQTHASLMPHLVEECYEVLDALSAISSAGASAGEPEFAHLEEELGDLLFQILFHTRLAQEEGHFTLAGVAKGIHDKLVHRHPHVFGTVEATTPEHVVRNWEAIKKEEKGRGSVTEGIPTHLPSLMLASKLQRKALSIGVAPSQEDLDLAELIGRLEEATRTGDHDDADAPAVADAVQLEVAVGQLLFEVADLARRVGVDAEQALRTQATSLRDRIVAAEGETTSAPGGVPIVPEGTH
jgi:tetrapyrrole methylase family protein/MazG family protein